MTRWKLPVVAVLLAVAAACDGAPTAPAAPADGARPTAPAFHHSTPISIQAPLVAYTAQPITATASIAGSWRYKWEYRWCFVGNVGGDCNYLWYPVADGQDITSVTKNIYEQDRWLDFRVTVLDIYGHVVATDTHRVQGPYTMNNVDDGGCTSGGPC